MASRATWADAWRGAGHRETASWHFVDIELAAPDISPARFGFPASANPASAGPVQDCVVDKVRKFAAELASPATLPPERVLAIKYLLHSIGDLHQPLSSSDNQDPGGSCVMLALDGRRIKLHAWCDTVVVGELGADPGTLAATLQATITPAQVARWPTGDAGTLAQEVFAVARATAYRVGSAPGCSTGAAPIALPPGYDDAARTAAALQLQRAGVRFAMLLDRSLSGTAVESASRSAAPNGTLAPVAQRAVAGKIARSPASL